MSASKGLLWLLNKLWLSLAIVLVLAAVLMSALRYALPHIPDVSEQLEAQLEARLQQPIEISSLAMSWHRQGPALDVTGIQLAGQTDSPVQVDVGQVSVVLDFWQSLLQQQLVAQEFILNQATIDIDLRGLQAQDSEALNLDTLESLFLQQLERFSLTESELNVINLAGNRRSIVIERLSWLNRGRQHQGIGQFRVRDFTRNSLDFIIKLDGNDLSTVNGQFYVDSRQIDISPWLEQQLSNVDITESKVNFTSWLTLVDGNISSGLLQLRDNVVAARINEQDLQLHIAQGQIAIQPRQQGWLLNVLPMTLEINEQQIELPLIAWQSSQQQHQLSARRIPIHDLAPFVPLLLPDTRGVIEQQINAGTQAFVDAKVMRDAEGHWDWLVHSDSIQSDGDEQVPSFSPIAVTVAGHNAERGYWSAQADEFQLSSSRLSDAAIWQQQAFSLMGNWHHNDAGWQFELGDGQWQLGDLDLQLQGRLKQMGDDTPSIALLATAEQSFAVATARDLLPLAMGEGVRDYLNESLVAGDIRGLEVLWRGPLQHFPDDDMAGVFNARVDFAGLDYQFQADWPMLQDTPLRLDFYQHGLFMFSDAGQLMDVTVDAVRAKIPDLTDGGRGLQLQSSVSAAAGSLKPVFDASPLQSVAETLTQVQPRSAIKGDFRLDIPFDGSRDVDVSVLTDLAGQEFYVTAIDQSFTVKSGTLMIDNAQVSTRDLIMNWYGRPINTEIVGNNKDSDYLLTVSTAIDWQLEPLLENLPSDGWQRYFYGAINGTGELELLLGDQVNVDWTSQYDLTGLESNLPAPLAKDFGENWQLQLNLSGDPGQLQLDVNVDDRLDWSSRWQPGVAEWQQASLVLGEQPSSQRATLAQGRGAFVISALLPQVNIGEWYDLVYFMQQSDDGTDDTAEGSSIPPLAPDYITVTTPLLMWAGQQFADAEFEIWPDNTVWNGRVFANDLALEIRIPEDFIESPIEVDADFVQLSSELDGGTDNPVRESEGEWQWVTRLPAINVNCKTCKLDDKSFVDVRAQLKPVKGGVELSNLSARSNNSQINSSGYWLVDDGKPHTQISGQLSSEDFGDLLREYGLETAIRDSAAEIEFGLNWDGHPHQLDFDSLGGSMSWELGQGYLAEVSDGGARLFSLLSLDGILRKLTLDFRDIFSQGMFYTNLSGSVQVANGVATTNDTQMLGSAGNMEIKGTTNLVTEELNYQLTYAPKVTSSLPVILAWMVNPPSGLAALLIDKVLQDAEVISQLRYQVTGTISEPVVTEVDRNSRPVDIPELDIPQEDQPSEPTNATSADGGSVK